MPIPSPEIIQMLTTFRGAFTRPTYEKGLVLMFGTILTPGRRTVTAALRIMGRGCDKRFGKYHRVLNQASWSVRLLSRLLLGVLVRCSVPTGAPLVLLVDETLERRRGDQIKWRGWVRDAVRSTTNRVAFSLGIRWLCVALLVQVPWSQRPWALPFLVIPVPTKKTNQKLGKRHRTIVDLTIMAIGWVRRWQPDRQIILVGDGSYAAVRLVKNCRDLRPAVTLVSRLRLDANLYDPPQPQPKSKRGRKPQKGLGQTSLADRLADPATEWQSVTVPWYGGTEKQLEIVTGRSLWHRNGHVPVPIGWVLIRCPQDPHFKPMALFCSDQDALADQIITWFVGRWNIEVTFEELRAHLGFETQRHWSQAAVERTAPCLFGIFSLVVVMAKLLHPEPASLPIRQDSWYPKHEATFSDALAAVRRHLWHAWNYEHSAPAPQPIQFPAQISGPLLDALCYAA